MYSVLKVNLMDKWDIYATQFILYDYLSENVLYTLNTYTELSPAKSLLYNNIKKKKKTPHKL